MPGSKDPGARRSGIERSVARGLSVSLLAAAALHVVASVVGGLVAATGTDTSFPSGRARAGQVLSTFGQAGGAVEALLVIVALGVIAWQWRDTVADGRALAVARVLLVAVALLVVARCVGVTLLATAFSSREAAANLTLTLGAGLGDLVLCAGGLLAAASIARADEIDDDEPVIFAVDRADGEVFAFFSRPEAIRSLNVYSIEDDEFRFYDDEGRVVVATVDRERVTLTVTEEESERELLGHLRRFAQAHGLRVPADEADEPWAYATPISDWQWLQLWPGWLRPFGRLVRAMSGGRSRSQSRREAS